MPDLDKVVRRHMRKLAARAGYVRPVKVYRSSIDYKTGEIRTRTRRANRKTKWMNGQAGFISVKDGEQSARELTRLLEWYAKQCVSAAPTSSAHRPANAGSATGSTGRPRSGSPLAGFGSPSR